MMKQTLFIHIGLPKTATTTLQNRIFPNHSEYLYLGKYNSIFSEQELQTSAWLRQLKVDLVSKELPFFENKIDNLFDLLDLNFNGKVKNYSKLLLSEEGFISRCMSPNIYDGKMIMINSCHSILEKIKTLFNAQQFDIKLILTIRKQNDLIHSIFAEDYYLFRRYFKFSEIDQYLDYLFGQGHGGMAYSCFDYYSLVKRIDYLFGKENVLVLPYEMLSEHPEQFLNNLSLFMGISPWDSGASILSSHYDNRRLLKGQVPEKLAKLPVPRSIRLMNRIKKKLNISFLSSFIDSLNNWNKLSQKKIFLTADNSRRIMDEYFKSNELLAVRVPEVTSYGYTISSYEYN